MCEGCDGCGLCEMMELGGEGLEEDVSTISSTILLN